MEQLYSGEEVNPYYGRDLEYFVNHQGIVRGKLRKGLDGRVELISRNGVFILVRFFDQDDFVLYRAADTHFCITGNSFVSGLILHPSLENSASLYDFYNVYLSDKQD